MMEARVSVAHGEIVGEGLAVGFVPPAVGEIGVVVPVPAVGATDVVGLIGAQGGSPTPPTQ